MSAASLPPDDGVDVGAPIGERSETSERPVLGRLYARARLVWYFHCPPLSTFFKETPQAVTASVRFQGMPAVGKFFRKSPEGRAAFAAERASYDLFFDRVWRMPVLRWGRRSFIVPRLNDDSRLDVLARTMSEKERLDAAAWAVDVLLDIYLSGHFHGDMQPHNVWRTDGRFVVTDFETFGERTPGIPFHDSADITGTDPGRVEPLDAAFDPDDEWSFHHVLGVSLEQAVREARRQLENRVSKEARTRWEALDGQDW